MSIERDREYLCAELAQLDRLIAGCDPDEEITRLGFEARRAQVERELREMVRDEADLPVAGVLEGILPNARRFEMRRSDTGELISGRISKEMRDTDTLKHYIDHPCMAHLRVITFQRPGREHRCYELRSIGAVDGHREQ